AWTAKGAHAAAATAADVAADRLTVEPQRADSAVEHLGVLADDVPGYGHDVEDPLNAFEQRRQRAGVVAIETVLRFPTLQHLFRRPKACARVDDGCPADRLAERQRHDGPAESHRRPLITVRTQYALKGRAVEVFLGKIAAFFDDQYGGTC